MRAEELQAIITFLFLLVILSYYILIFIPAKKLRKEKDFKSITVIIPAHNEERFINSCIESVIKAQFNGKKQIIVVDDGSTDGTNKIASSHKEVVLIKTKHTGKAASINLAIKQSKGELIAIVDADSEIEQRALVEMSEIMSGENVGAACGVVKVKNRKKPLGMWLHLEQLYNSLMRGVFSKVNANIVTPGPLSMYRKDALNSINGFGTKGFAEDVDVAIRLSRKGYIIAFSEKSVSETNMPYTAKGFLKQRMRFARGIINILKRHLGKKKTIIDYYTLPLLLFSYVQAIIIGAFTLYQIITGYYTYFLSQGTGISLAAARFFFEWLSIIGFAKWAYGLFTGATPLTFLAIVGVTSSLLSYPLFLYSIIKFDKKIDLLHIFPFIFMFPFWLIVMIVYMICLPEIFIKHQNNKWTK